MSQKEMIARKVHYCHLCGKKIQPGCQYVQEKTNTEGKWETMNRHIHCDAMLDAWSDIYGGDGYEDEYQIMDDIWEHVCEGICTEADRNNCGLHQIFACERCQKEMLNPSILGAAMQSVRENLSED